MRDPRVAWPVLRDTLRGIEQNNPASHVVWTTIPLERSDNYQRNWMNQQIRAYASEHRKPLFDIASLQSTGTNGKRSQDEQGEILSDDWREAGRSDTMNEAGELQLAKAWWVLLASLEDKKSSK
jgi:hypothetical protein